MRSGIDHEFICRNINHIYIFVYMYIYIYIQSGYVRTPIQGLMLGAHRRSTVSGVGGSRFRLLGGSHSSYILRANILLMVLSVGVHLLPVFSRFALIARELAICLRGLTSTEQFRLATPYTSRKKSDVSRA